MALKYQIVGFHFQVSFSDIPTTSASANIVVGFQSITGLDVQIEKEALKEGGENRFEHSLPGRTKYTPLVLKRGIVTPNESDLTKWCQNAFHDLVIVPITTVNVELLNDNHDVLMHWELSHVWPVSWKIGELNAEKSEVLIETLELNYNRYRLVETNT